MSPFLVLKGHGAEYRRKQHVVNTYVKQNTVYLMHPQVKIMCVEKPVIEGIPLSMMYKKTPNITTHVVYLKR